VPEWDYLETDKDVQKTQVATLGCSIGGKGRSLGCCNGHTFWNDTSGKAGHGGDAILAP